MQLILAILMQGATPSAPPDWPPPDFADRLRDVMMAAESRRTAADVLTEQLATFHGKPTKYVIDHLGYPDKRLVVEGAVVYSWINETSNLDGSPLRCVIKVVARAAVVRSADVSGNNGACASYARRLDPTYRFDY